MIKKISLLLGLALFFIACQQTEKGINSSSAAIDTIETLDSDDSEKPDRKAAHVDSDKETEEKILDILAKLPEYQKTEKYIDSLSKGKKGVASMLDKPTANEPDYYKVSVGYNGDARFETYYLFYVNPNTADIKIMDEVTGDVVSMDVWRKRKQDENKLK